MTHFLTLALLIVNLPSHLNLLNSGIKIKVPSILCCDLTWISLGPIRDFSSTYGWATSLSPGSCLV